MSLSAGNRFAGTVTNVQRDCVGGVVTIDVNGTPITATITTGSIQRLGIQNGKAVVAVVNDGDVMLSDESSLQLSARNQFRAKVLDIDTGAVNTVIKLRGLGGNTIRAMITNSAAEKLDLKCGERVLVVIKASSVMIGLDEDAD